MIVLAIAGLMLLVVFEAIPALTRASRNADRKHDVGIILDAVSEYELKDSDNFPKNCRGGISSPSSCSACDGTGYPPGVCAASYPDPPNDYFLQFSYNELSYYTYNNPGITDPVTLTAESQGNSNLPPNTNTDEVDVYDYEICDSNGDAGATSVGADYNDVVALYALEGGGTTGIPQCQQL
jgi:hypothetical protein